MIDRSFNTYDWQREIHRRCGASGVAFAFDDKAETAYTDGRTIFVPSPPKDATQQDFEVLRAQVVHECGHIARPEAFEIVKDRGLTNRHPLFAIFNQLEDRIQEFEASKDLVGDRGMLDQLHTICNERFIRDSASWKFSDENSRSLTMRLAVSLNLGFSTVDDWMPRTARSMPDVLDALGRNVGPDGPALYDDLIREGWGKRLLALRGKEPAAVYGLCEELYKRLFPELPPPPPPGSGKGKGKGKGKPGEPGDAEGEGEGEGKAVEAEFGVIPWEHLLRSRHEDANDAGLGGGSTIDWTGKPRNRTPPVWYPKPRIEAPSVRAGRVAVPPGTPMALIGEVRRELQAKTKVKVTREKLHGRLDRRNLTRLVMPQVGDGTYNRSVFQQLSPGLKLDTAVTILVDCSGSMRGAKYEAAKAAAMSLYDLCGVALRVPCEVLGFTHLMDGPQIHVFKAFAEPRVRREDLYQRLEAGGQHMIGNSDGDALMVAYSRIRNQRNARKVIVVLSDGNPAEAMNGDADATLRAAVTEIRSKGVELYGIGIMDENVRRYYSKTAPVVKAAREVPEALLAVLRDVLQRATS